MNLLAPLLALYTTTTLTPPSPLPTPPNNYTTINFDHLPAPHGLSPLPTPHHNLLFTHSTLLTPSSPSLHGLISPNDLNCAVSAPASLLGSRPRADAEGASWAIYNATSMREEEGLQPWFTLHEFYVKPMDAPEEGEITVFVRGYRYDDGDGDGEEVLEWRVEFPRGFHRPFLVEMEKFSGRRWERVTKVVVEADFGVDALDWEVCVDDLVVQFFGVEVEGEDGGGGGGVGAQGVLKMGGEI